VARHGEGLRGFRRIGLAIVMQGAAALLMLLTMLLLAIGERTLRRRILQCIRNTVHYVIFTLC